LRLQAFMSQRDFPDVADGIDLAAMVPEDDF
jgi:hypothetical protein